MNTQEIPYGYCQCGCGQKTNIAPYNYPKYGWVKGEPIRFIRYHQHEKARADESPNPSGLCMCGCGQKTSIAKLTDRHNSEIKGQPMKYISGHNVTRYYKSIEDRFWASCPKGAPDSCWEWKGHRQPKGYGSIHQSHKVHMAHRIAYEIHFGPIPDNTQVLHKCDNPPCCNPNHLFLGSIADNMTDKTAKQRQARGENIGKAKFTESDIREMRRLYDTGVKQVDIAKLFGLSQGHVTRIVNRKAWTHVT
jgi:hypothetical protein